MAVVVPYWAVWPFETMVLMRSHVSTIAALSPDQRRSLGGALAAITKRYDALFGVPFPYSMGFHQSPADRIYPEWHLHAHYYPPLLHSPELRKYMVGYEMLAQPQRDLTAEEAAARLQALAPL